MNKNVVKITILFTIVVMLLCVPFLFAKKETIQSNVSYGYELLDLTSELNPNYVEYLMLTNEERDSSDVLPKKYLTTYESSGNENVSLPRKFDLRNYNNKNYTTAINSQGQQGICWSYAAVEQAESYAMLHNSNVTLSNKTLSARQLDYAVSTNGLKQGSSKYVKNHSLTKGGTYLLASSALAAGISLVPSSWVVNDNYHADKQNYYDVYNYSNSLYELENSIDFPYLDLQSLDYNVLENVALKNDYLNTIKSLIMQYGGAYIGTISPDFNCSSQNNDGNYITRVDNNCYSSGHGHAMQIIGFDDDYQYSYCVDNYGKHLSSSLCDNPVTGVGAWIIRNSWTSSGYQYIYEAYDSARIEIAFSSKLVNMSDRNWDQVYVAGPIVDSGESGYINYYYSDDFRIDLYKNINTPEKVEKLKFYTFGSDTNINVTLNNDYNKIVYAEYPGYYTVDFSNDNIIVNDHSFTVKISGDNVINNSVMIMTSNLDDNPVLKTNDYSYPSDLGTINGYYAFDLTTYTKNINSGSIIDFELYLDDEDVSDYLSYTNNIVGDNMLYPSIKIDSHIGAGTYTLITKYLGAEYSSVVELPNAVMGAGTLSDPYLIHDRFELDFVRTHLNAYYKLLEDIDFTGVSFEPLSGDNRFTGVFDGNNHTFSNLIMSGSGNFSVFGNVNGTIKNLRLDNITIRNTDSNDPIYYNGILASTSEEAIFDNIVIKNSSITCLSDYCGALVGDVNASSFNNIFSNVSIYNGMYSGFVGHVNSHSSFTNIMLFNNLYYTFDDNVYWPEYSGDLAGELYLGATTTIKNVISASKYYNYPTDFMGNIYTNSPNLINAYGYYVNGLSAGSLDIIECSEVDLSEIVKKSINDLTSASLYTSWDNFDTYFEKKNGYIPMLKNSGYNYTSIDDIAIRLGDSNKNIYQYIESDFMDAVHFDSYDEEVIHINFDGEIVPVNLGTTRIHVYNDFDGFDGYINVIVRDVNTYVMFNNNGGSGSLSNLYGIPGTTVTLSSNNFIKTGYLFSHYNTKADGTGTSYYVSDTLTLPEDNITLYAIYIPINYNIIYYNNLTATNITNNYSYLDNVIIPNGNVIDGYNFKYWLYGNNKYYANTTYTKLFNTNGSYMFNAFYEPITYSIKYDLGNTNILDSIFYNQNVTIKDINVNKEGYTFKYWSMNIDGNGNRYYPGNIVSNLSKIDNSIVTLYPIWDINTYTVKYNSDNVVLRNFNYLDNVVIEDNAPSKSGYIFDYWMDNDNKVYKPNDVINGINKNIVLNPVYKKLKSFNSSKYLINNGYIDNISPYTTLKMFENNVSYSGYNISLLLKDNVIYTGGSLSLYDGNVKDVTYTTVVRGDINGDGKVNSQDYITVKNHIMGSNKIVNEVNLLAADVNVDSRINSQDYISIKNYIMNGG